MNTLQYSLRSNSALIGSEAERQFIWIENNLMSAGNRKFLITSHIYAGGRVKHDDKVEAMELWMSKWNNRYFDLVEKYQSNIIMEIGAHDHWADVRVFDRANKGPIRSLYVATGVSP